MKNLPLQQKIHLEKKKTLGLKNRSSTSLTFCVNPSNIFLRREKGSKSAKNLTMAKAVEKVPAKKPKTKQVQCLLYL